MGDKIDRPGAFVMLFAPCPCCGRKMGVRFQTVGYTPLVEAQHWGQSEEQKEEEPVG